MSIFGKSPEREPVALPSRDGAGTVDLVRGARVVRRPIFQSPQNVDGWALRMVNAVAVAKQLGFTMFEIDVTPIQVPKPVESSYGISAMFIAYSAPIEGDEWKEESAKKLRESQLVTVYALVVE